VSDTCLSGSVLISRLRRRGLLLTLKRWAWIIVIDITRAARPAPPRAITAVVGVASAT